MIRRILVGLGGTPFAGTATRRAIELAAAHGAAVTAVTLLDPARFGDSGLHRTGSASEVREGQDDDFQLTRDALEEAVATFEHECREAGVEHRVLRESGDPLDQLVRTARYHDLVVCGLRGLFEYGLTKSPKESVVRLVRHGVQPILASALKYRPVERVLVAYSGSPDSARAMRAFVQLRLWPRCDLCIASFDKDEERADRHIADAAAYCEAHGYDTTRYHNFERPGEAILETARSWPADLIVMGDGAQGALSRKVLGDTPLHVVRHAERPVFLAH